MGETQETHQPGFPYRKLKLMLPAFGESVTELINKWESKVCERGSLEVDVWPYLISLSADAISRAAFGSRYEEGRKYLNFSRNKPSSHYVCAHKDKLEDERDKL
ncbi:hypothetical protein RDABS01_025790 [Bienertia sinuspersici]